MTKKYSKFLYIRSYPKHKKLKILFKLLDYYPSINRLSENKKQVYFTNYANYSYNFNGRRNFMLNYSVGALKF